MDNKQIMSLLVLVGALIAVVGIFLGWIVLTTPLTEMTYSGWDIISEDGNSKIYIILALVFALIVLIGALINFVGMLPEEIAKYNSILLLVLGLLTAIMALVFFMNEISGEGNALLEVSAGIGLWLTLVGGILIAIPGIMGLVKK